MGRKRKKNKKSERKAGKKQGLTESPPTPQRPQRHGDRSERSLQMPLTRAGIALLVLGLILVAFDVVLQTQHLLAWLPIIAGTLSCCAAALMQLSVSSATAESAPTDQPPKSRRRVLYGAVAVLALQALIPLRYYWSGQRYDERFSWRMFSAVRMHQCQLSASEETAAGERNIELGREIHVAWINNLRRNRERVITRFLEFRCDQAEVNQVRLENRCITPSGERLEPIRRSLDCQTGERQAEGALQ